MALVKLSYVRGIPDVLTSRDIDIFVDINTHAPQQQLKLSPGYSCDVRTQEGLEFRSLLKRIRLARPGL